MMLDEHPEGLSRSAIFVALHKGWLDTDYYRAYEQYLAEQRKSYSHVVPRRRIKVEYGSDEFKMRAQRWAISRTLGSMKKLGTVHRDGDLWRKGKRAPRITVQESKPRYVTHDWAAERRNAYRASTNAAVRREEIKAELWTALSDGRLKGRARQVIQHAYDYLSGG